MLSRVFVILAAVALGSFTKSEPFAPDPNPSPIPVNPPGNRNNVIIGYYQASRTQSQKPSSIPWDHYTDMVFFGAWPIDQFEFTFGSDQANQEAVQDMQQFVQYAKNCLSWGWGESKGQSGAKAGAESRKTFVQRLVALASGYGFQGVVVSWLSPNDVGAGCNYQSPNDVLNFGLFAQEFKNVWNEGHLIVRSTLNGFIGATGNYATSDETSLLAQHVDYIDLMAYDGYTGNKGESTGPFSALTAQCPKIPYLANGIKELLQIMQSQGFQSQKLILGFTGYGRLFYLPQGFSMKTEISQVAYGAAPQGGWTDNLNGTLDACRQKRGFEGIYLLNEILENGWLAPDGVKATEVLTRGWDECAIQPYLYNKDYLLVYDDPKSLAIKSNYAKGAGLAGISFYYSMGFPKVFFQAAASVWGSSREAPIVN